MDIPSGDDSQFAMENISMLLIGNKPSINHH